MNKSTQRNYEELARSLGLRFDGEGGAIYGQRGAYDFIIYPERTNYAYMLTVAVSAQRTTGPLTKEECKQFKGENKPVAALTQNGLSIKMQMKNYSKQSTLQENLAASIDALVNFLRVAGFQNCCQACGGENPSACYVSGGYVNLCSDCFTKVQHDSTLDHSKKQGKKENVVGGIVGALIGSLLGVVSIIVFSQLGYVAALSGVIMAVCTLKGYELLGGKMSKKAVIISVALMALMTLVGDRLDWAIVVMRELEVDFITAYRIIPLLMEEEIIETSTYVGNLVMQYLFVLLGAIPTIINAMKSSKVQDRIYRLGSVSSLSDMDM